MDAADHQPEAGARRVGGDEAERRPALEHRLLGRPDAADLEEVVHHPDDVEAGVLGVAAIRASVGAMAAAPPGQVKEGIWRPTFMARE